MASSVPAHAFARAFLARMHALEEEIQGMPWTGSNTDRAIFRARVREMARLEAWSNGVGYEAAAALAEYALLTVFIDHVPIGADEDS